MMSRIIAIGALCALSAVAPCPPLCYNGSDECGIGCGNPYNYRVSSYCTAVIGGCCSYHREDWDCNCTFGVGHGWLVSGIPKAGWTCNAGIECDP